MNLDLKQLYNNGLLIANGVLGYNVLQGNSSYNLTIGLDGLFDIVVTTWLQGCGEEYEYINLSLEDILNVETTINKHKKLRSDKKEKQILAKKEEEIKQKERQLTLEKEQYLRLKKKYDN